MTINNNTIDHQKQGEAEKKGDVRANQTMAGTATTGRTQLNGYSCDLEMPLYNAAEQWRSPGMGREA